MIATRKNAIVYVSPRTGGTHVYLFREGFERQVRTAIVLDYMRPDLDFNFDDVRECLLALDRMESQWENQPSPQLNPWWQT